MIRIFRLRLRNPDNEMLLLTAGLEPRHETKDMILGVDVLLFCKNRGLFSKYILSSADWANSNFRYKQRHSKSNLHMNGNFVGSVFAQNVIIY